MTLDKNTPILIADDDEISREVLCIALNNLGFENIHQAEDGEKALSTGRACSPRFALLDIYMPGMDGWEVAKKLKKESPGTIVIMISGSRDMADMEEAVGVDGYIFKPIDPDALLNEMTRNAAK